MKRHDLDVISLLFGSVFFLLGGVFLVGGTAVPGSHVGALWPVPLIALGLIIALMALRTLPRDAGSREP
jgi:hypothetical protein